MSDRLAQHVVVDATYRGRDWWDIVLDCGHAAKVLVGPISPLGDRVSCSHCERAEAAWNDDPTADALEET